MCTNVKLGPDPMSHDGDRSLWGCQSRVCWTLSQFFLPFLLPNRAEGSSKIQSRIEQQQQQMRSACKTPTSGKNSSPAEKMSPTLPMDDIERELMAEVSAIDQMSSSDSSSESKSSSSSSSGDSSSDSEDETHRSSHSTSLSLPQQNHFTSSMENLHNKSQDNGGQLMSTLRNDLQLSETGSDSDD
ncbi:ELL-associated factor 2 [Pelobates cultripes]|uniref:ELL-associated factor 2 n=1 Tax=Pelobates cultripes TaxID=61616 RepID=A0AAD1SR29_PELCU|nr:ELL-associated factor 2 [Pelobates cultripes]